MLERQISPDISSFFTFDYEESNENNDEHSSNKSTMNYVNNKKY